jgi:hypothetical protein
VFGKELLRILSFKLLPTVSIRIVAGSVVLSCQDTRKLKRAATLKFTTESAIILIHCWQLSFSCIVNIFYIDVFSIKILVASQK